jgi:signal transduction histidine kinase
MMTARMIDKTSSPRPLRWSRALLLLALVLPWLVGYVIDYQRHMPVLDATLDGHSGLVLKVAADSFADWAGLHQGDVIVSVDGIPFAQWTHPELGNPVAEIKRGEQLLTLELPMVSLLQSNRRSLGMGIMVALIFWGGGTLLLWRRPRHQGVIPFFLMSQSFAIAIFIMLAFPASVRPRRLSLLSIASFHLAAPLFLHQTLLFPRVLGTARQRRHLLIPLYLLAALMLLALLFGGQWGRLLGVIYTTAEISLALGVLLYSYRRATPNARRRLRVILTGNMIAGLPSILFYLLPGILGLSFRLPLWMMGPFLAIAPLGYLYAIARHNLFGIDHLLNRALVYFLLSLGILLLYLGPFAAIYRQLPANSSAQMLMAVGLTMLVGFSFDWARTRVQKVVDGIFYGGWYDYASVIETISDDLARTLDRERLAQVLTRQTPALMHLHPASFIIDQAHVLTSLARTHADALPFYLSFRQEVRALWLVGRRIDGDDLTATDRRILKTLARQAEIALSNVLLIETLQSQLHAIRASRELLTKTQQQLLRSREQERARLSRDLHDGPIQELVGLNLQLGLLISQMGPDSYTTPPLKTMRTEINNLLHDMRRICTELRPQMLDALGLAAAVQALAEEWSVQHHVPVSLHLTDHPLTTLPDEVAVNLYRIVQEALSNIARHARAQQVSIHLLGTDTHLHLKIVDDGCGFTASDSLHHLADAGHFGLVGMSERAKLIGGEWGADSAPGQGTKIWVQWDKTT